MNFLEAVKLLKLDKNINLMRRTKDFEITYGLIGINLTITDILAEDWYVIKSEILYPFEEAIASLRKGKSIRRKDWINTFSVDADDDNYYFTIDDVNANDWIIIDKEETK